ncbi:alpha/beta fold hydrolase [Flavobacterium sp. XGLA_31]|uniref:alpha/beta fold hydrolase n=1 Tax=Flavobacterium sp. XGLA_31 TaxID=3447666 RepID=UPI003F34C667
MEKVVLLHGALGSAENFTILAQLLQPNFEVFTLNFEGHGQNHSPQNILTIEGFAQQVLAFLDENNIETINVFGYSMGGYVGLYLAKNHPERITKLFTLATKLQWTPEGSQKEAALLNPETIKEKVPKFASALKIRHGENWETLLRQTAAMMLGLGQSPVLKNADFAQISLPVLMAVGDKDAMVSFEETIAVYRQLEQGQFLVIPNTQHPIEKVNPEELAHQIRRYFNA